MRIGPPPFSRRHLVSKYSGGLYQVDIVVRHTGRPRPPPSMISFARFTIGLWRR
jgi:hypothetical protein